MDKKGVCSKFDLAVLNVNKDIQGMSGSFYNIIQMSRLG